MRSIIRSRSSALSFGSAAAIRFLLLSTAYFVGRRHCMMAAAMSAPEKIDVPAEHWDRLFAPSSCLATITTIDGEGRVNAASYGTCTRVCHDPVYIAFTVGAIKHTADNIRATGEFVVNLPTFPREMLEKVRVVALPF